MLGAESVDNRKERDMPKMTGAKLLADTVYGYGIRDVFFMPYIAPRALMEMEKLGIKRVQTHGEKSAAYMADAYARVRRKPALCMAQSVGALNLAAGLQDAWLSCSPVVAITGREHQRHQLRHAYQEADHRDPFAAVTSYSAWVPSPDQLAHHLRQAFRSAVSGTPSPTHLDLEGIDGGAVVDVEAELEVIIEPQFASVPPFRPVAAQADMNAALSMLARAERPVIVAGGGVTASDAREELVALAEKLCVPVATALNAKPCSPPTIRWRWDCLAPIRVNAPTRSSARLTWSSTSQPHRRAADAQLPHPAAGRECDAAGHQRHGNRSQLCRVGRLAWRCPRDPARHA